MSISGSSIPIVTMMDCCGCGTSSMCTGSLCTYTGSWYCCETAVWQNFGALMYPIPGFRPCDWCASGSSGEDQSYYGPTDTYCTLTITSNGFLNYTSSTDNTPCWVEVVYYVHSDIGDVYAMTLSDSIHGLVFTASIDDYGTASFYGNHTGSIIIPQYYQDPSGDQYEGSWAYVSGSRTPSNEGWIQEGSDAFGHPDFIQGTSVTFSLSNPQPINGEAGRISLAEEVIIPLDGVLFGYNISGSRSNINMNHLYVTQASIGSVPLSVPPPGMYMFKTRTPDGIVMIYADNWYANPPSNNLPYNNYAFTTIFENDFMAQDNGTVEVFWAGQFVNCGNIWWNARQDFPDGTSVSNGGNPLASNIFPIAGTIGLPVYSPYQAIGQDPSTVIPINTASLGCAMGMCIEIANSINMGATVSFPQPYAPPCYAFTPLCFGFSNWMSCDTGGQITSVYTYDFNPYEQLSPVGCAAGQFVSCSLSEPQWIYPPSTTKPWFCDNAGAAAENPIYCCCAGTPVICNGAFYPLFCFGTVVNNGCCVSASCAYTYNCGDQCLGGPSSGSMPVMPVGFPGCNLATGGTKC